MTHLKERFEAACQVMQCIDNNGEFVGTEFTEENVEAVLYTAIDWLLDAPDEPILHKLIVELTFIRYSVAD